jgi:hypothetical protein
MHWILSGTNRIQVPDPPSWWTSPCDRDEVYASQPGADRIGVSLGRHRPTVLLKLLCLVEKKQTKLRSLVGNLIFLIQTSLKIFWPEKEIEKEHSGEKPRRTSAGAPLGRSDRAGRPTLFRGPVRSGFPCTTLFRFLSPWEKIGPVNLRKKLQKNKRKTIYKNSYHVFRPTLDVWALLPWWKHQHGEGARRRVCSKP